MTTNKKIIVSLLVLGVAFFMARYFWLGKSVDAYSVQQGELRQTLVASGRVLWPHRISVSAQITGQVMTIPVTEGQQVTRGQLLIQLDDATAQANVAQTTAAVAQAQTQLRQLTELTLPTAQENVKQARATAQQLRKQLQRIQTLRQQDFASQAELEDAQRSFTVANSQVRNATLQLQNTQHDGSQLALAEAALQQAQANLQSAQVQLVQTQIVAPADGTLITRSVEAGDIVQPGKVLMTLAAKGDTQIEVQVDEKNLGQLTLGQSALVSADAYADQQFSAQLIYINPGIDATRGAVQIKLRVPEPPDYLRQDMTVSVDIETAFRDNTLTIATAALHDINTDPWVMVVREHRAQRQAVELGLRGDNQVEILKGLQLNEPVMSASNALVKPGQRVHVQSAP
jgi:HlyD family secretion protein